MWVIILPQSGYQLFPSEISFLLVWTYLLKRFFRFREISNFVLNPSKLRDLTSLVAQTSLVASLVAQTVKNPPTKWGTWVGYLGWEDPLEQGMATHSSNLAWRITMGRGA